MKIVVMQNLGDIPLLVTTRWNWVNVAKLNMLTLDDEERGKGVL